MKIKDNIGVEEETLIPEGENINAAATDPLPEVEKKSIDLGFLMAKSPNVPIEEYLNHPLNFLNSKGLAQIIRGLEGMFQELNYALIDILVGTLRFSKERKNVNTVQQ